jgi:putative NIF3 family GTP cyclohydrolase 1 type 2
MNTIAAGHYATETVGVKALMPLVREAFGVETVFIDDAKDYDTIIPVFIFEL